MNMQNNLSSASLNNIFTDWPNVVHQYFFTMMRNISPENYWATIVPLLDQRWATLLQCYLTTLIIFNIFFFKWDKVVAILSCQCCHVVKKLQIEHCINYARQHCATLSFWNDNVATTFRQPKLPPGYIPHEFNRFVGFRINGLHL